MWASALMPGSRSAREDRLDVDAGRREQRVAEIQVRCERRRIGPGEAGLGHDAAHEREAVGMHAGGGQAEQQVTDHDPAREQGAALGRADGEAGEVVVAARVEARHLRRLTTDQRRPGLAAAGGDALDDRRADMRIEPPRREIIEEEEGFGALHHEVVDAHGDEVDADARVPPGLDGDLHLRADAVVGGHEDRIAEAGGLEVEQTAEAADLGIGARPSRRPHQRLDTLDHGVARHRCRRRRRHR